ncbi:aldehyde dehydrogenase family protein [Cyanobacterium aponinum UTEX 3222]|uniref:Gamma-glutamyl phosphate reductase n=3 Tax=Cyanobacterium aponinum TaxID=379064 RepID=K9Z2I0_CYAAP|nr:aldehyde dehydrogenase family protein [Cyanobacterium aponinum]WRL40699.1 aldehyde dehydrogenase family protein [Cyanobacterium aponinum UTEX 3222]AFZ52770.1 glutamate-5-semialdehyde dehydrogenase [Cyanobacterium aponinum PCC 10605]MBD2392894.1 aldehyde dehydrogenase family protein [Cyanobacterium aponinum FACHB-4101]MTF37922.1 aldehyde dehydrogenase family protein [Cyanobacterium aponinum 0216]PHV62310.1 gamma-glutamyl-phosphate reductase [Cyanobacterium aponinum IPPAS B-1201]
MNDSELQPIDIVTQQAHQAFIEMGSIKGVERSKAVKQMAIKLKECLDDILQANTLDLEISKEMAVPELISDWLKLTPQRLESAIEILETLAELPDPFQKVINSPYQVTYCQNYSQLMPLGVIALIYEALPELAIITAGLAIKTGNSLILRGSSEASNTNSIIAQALQIALEDVDFPSFCLQFLPSEQGFKIEDLVTQDQYINLIIPYGRPSLIQEVTQFATAPVLKSAMGNCYLYWSLCNDLELVKHIITDSYNTIPDPVNAIEKVLINCQQKSNSITRLFNHLQEQKFTLLGDEILVNEYPEHLQLISTPMWGKPFLNHTIAFRVVDDLSSAIAWINNYSSGHANCLITDSYQEGRIFAMETDSALVYVNSSPRFYRYLPGSNSVFLGISNQKGNRRGLISLETFTTVKQIVVGSGEV